MNEPLGPMTVVLLAIPALALRLAVQALYGRQRLSVGDPMRALLSVSSSIMFVMAGLGLVAGMMGLWFTIIPLVVVFIILALMTIDRIWHSEHRALAEAIERGEPLAQAVRTARLRMGTAMKLAVRLGDRLGLLGPAMQQQLSATQEVDGVLQNALARFFYLGCVTWLLSGVTTFVMLKIVPVFQRMFAEFGLKLPPMTNVVINFSNWIVEQGWVLLLPYLGLAMPAFFIVSVLYFVGWLPRNIPLWWSLFKRFDGAIVMRGLALSVRRGLPMPHAMRLVADCYPLSIVAGRVWRAAERVEAGQDWCESLRQTGLIGQADAAVLAAAERTGHLDWALEEMADSALRRQTYWIQALVSIVFPILLFALGSFVAMFAIGMFSPIIALIRGLS